MDISSFLYILLSTLFLVAAVSKWTDPKGFRQTLEGLRLKAWVARWSLLCVPALEVVIAGLLLWDRTMFLGLLGALLMLSAFSLVTWSAMRKKLMVNCNCFGQLTRESFGWTTIARIAVMALVSLFLIVRAESPDLFALSWVDWLATVLTSVGFLLLYAGASSYAAYRQAWKAIDKEAA